MPNIFPALLLAIGAAAAGQAQPVAAPEDETIVVQGVRDQRKEIGRFVDALTDAPVAGQLSRFDWAVCPAAVGLGNAQTAALTRRLTQVARAAAIPVARPGCAPNVLLIVALDKADFIAGLRRKHPAYFKGIDAADVKRMIDDPSPAAAWHVEGTLDADGAEVKRDGITGQQIVERTDVPSRLSTMTRPHFISSVVVVELDALAGMTVTQVADYAAMRAFARTDPSRLARTNAPTILASLDAPMDSPVPLSLTEWDLAFLKSLYSSRPNRRAGLQREEMKGYVRRTMDARKPGE